MILILPVWFSFSNEAALVSLNLLLLLVDGGPILLGVFSQASLSADLIVFTFEEPDRLDDLGTPGRVLLLGVLGLGEGSYFSTGFVILPNLLVPDPDDPVMVDGAVSSVILNSGLASFCFSGSIPCASSSEAGEVN